MTSKERVERIALLKRQAELMRSVMSGPSVSDESLRRYHEVLTEIARIQRIEDGFLSIMTFAQQYFTGDPPHDLLKFGTPSPPFHYELAEYLREASLDPLERKTAIAAPRSHAKSTIVTNIYVLWLICYVEDVGSRYIVLISDKQDGARRFADVVKAEIEDNELLRADFGDLKGDTWNALEIITSNKVKVTGAGSQEAMRGLRYGSFRPSTIIMDDIENDESVSTPERIAKNLDFLDRVVLPLGDPKSSKFFLIGTILHFNSVLNQVLNDRSDWKAFKFQAVIEFPTDMALWNAWEAMLYDRSEGANPIESSRIARAKAMQFYRENREQMEAGAKVLWPERMPLLNLMEKRSTNRMSFNSEYQNLPVDESTRIFHTVKHYESYDVDIADLDVFGACDPSMGASRRADPSAIVTVGRHQRTGVIYVLDVDVKRRHPDEIVQAIFRKARQFTYTVFSIETIAFQAFLRDEVVKRSAEQSIYIPIKEFKSTVKKHVRIAALEPLFSNGIIRVLPTQRDLIEQMTYFPKGKDDILDCLAQVLDLAKQSGAGSFSFGRL